MSKFLLHSMLVLLLSNSLRSWSQQEWGYGQFSMNLFDSNLAYAGQHETPSFGLRHRQQWTGIQGGPISSFASFHMPLAQQKMGTGLRFLHETIGARTQSYFMLAAAYRLRLKNASLNFALGMGYTRMIWDWNKLNVRDIDDPQIDQWQGPKGAALVNAALFYSRKNLYAGVEASQLNNASFGSGTPLQVIHFKAVAGYHQKVRKEDQIQLSILAKMAQPDQWQSDITLVYVKNNRFGLGTGYRLYKGVLILAQVYFSDTFRLGLNYDLSTQSAQSSYYGSVEVFLGYTINKGTNKSIRYL